MDLDIKLKEVKNLNKNFRYIIKTGINDLILLTKIVGVSYWEEEDPKKYLEGNNIEQNPSSKRKQSPQGKPTPKRFQQIDLDF